METVDYTKPIEVVNSAGRVLTATVGPDYNGAGSPPIWTDGALFSVSVNMLARIGWRVRNVAQ